MGNKHQSGKARGKAAMREAQQTRQGGGGQGARQGGRAAMRVHSPITSKGKEGLWEGGEGGAAIAHSLITSEWGRGDCHCAQPSCIRGAGAGGGGERELPWCTAKSHPSGEGGGLPWCTANMHMRGKGGCGGGVGWLPWCTAE